MSFFLEGLDVNTSVTSSGIDMQAVNAALKTKDGLRVAAVRQRRRQSYPSDFSGTDSGIVI
jgi:hypothetical protein